jgi:hypothetical protein
VNEGDVAGVKIFIPQGWLSINIFAILDDNIDR